MSSESPFLDVNGDGTVAPGDALLIVNDINRNGARRDTVFGGSPEDVNFDRYITAIDVLCIINYLNQPQVTTTIGVQILDADTVGFTESEVEQAIRDGLAMVSDVAAVRFDFESAAPRVTYSTFEIYLGNGIHAGGIQQGSKLGLHDGRVGAFRHSGARGPLNESIEIQVFANVETIARVALHEWMHSLGFQHDSDPSCLMHAGATSSLCDAEKQALARLFAIPGGPIGDPTIENIDFSFFP